MRLHRSLLALASGFVLTFAYPRWNVEILVWVWMLPLLYALWAGQGGRYEKGAKDQDRPQTHSSGLRKALGIIPRSLARIPASFRLGYLAGLAFFIPNLAWVRHSSRVISGAVGDEWMGWGVELMGMAAVCALSAYLAIYWGLWAAFAGSVGRPRISADGKPVPGDAGTLFSVSLESLRSAFLNAAAWAGLEWARGIVLTGFPWNGLGVVLHDEAPLIQSADTVGVTGLSFLPVFVICICYNTVLRFRQEVSTSKVRPHADFFCAIGLMLLNFGYGAWRMAQVPSDTVSLNVLLVQQNHSQARRWEALRVLDAAELYEKTDPARLEQAQKTISGVYTGFADVTKMFVKADLQKKPDLVVWPESALPFDLELSEHKAYFDQLLAEGDFSLLTGVDISELNQPRYTGAALMKGKFERQQLYRKVQLVPFGEYLPLRSFPGMQMLLGGVIQGDFTPGTSTEPMIMERPFGVQLIPLVCFEDTFGRFARKFVQDSPQLIVNMTNDGWFLQSEESEVHLANAIFRCVELRRPMARACNTGVTCFIDAWGMIGPRDTLRDPKTGSCFIKGALPKEIKLARNPPITFYARHGDVFSISMLAAMLLAVCVRQLKRKQRR